LDRGLSAGIFQPGRIESAGVSDMAMTASSGLAQGAGDVPAAGQAERSPFARTTELLAPYQPGKPLITLSLGEPQHPVPDFVGPVLAKHIADFGRYPLARGIEPFRVAAANWLSSRFRLPRAVDPETEVLVLNGSREGLFFAAITASRFVGPRKGRPAILMPNPFYPAYGAGARAAGCEQVYLPTTVANGFLPDLDSLDDALLARTVAIFIASPANPQGSVVAPQELAYQLQPEAQRPAVGPARAPVMQVAVAPHQPQLARPVQSAQLAASAQGSVVEPVVALAGGVEQAAAPAPPFGGVGVGAPKKPPGGAAAAGTTHRL
jgi:hypothetical protein